MMSPKKRYQVFQNLGLFILWYAAYIWVLVVSKKLWIVLFVFVHFMYVMYPDMPEDTMDDRKTVTGKDNATVKRKPTHTS